MGGFFLGLQPSAARVSPFGPSFVLSGGEKNLLEKKKKGGKKMSGKKIISGSLQSTVGSRQVAVGRW